MKNNAIWAVLIIVVAGLVWYNAKENTDAPQNIKMGAVLAITGYAAIDGENIKNGIELARADLAKEGIVLDVEYYDDATDPKKTVAGVSYMNDKGIKTIFGPTWSYQISAALPVIAQNGMTAVIADTSSDVVDGNDSDKTRLIHGVSPIYQIQSPTENWIKENKITNLAILTVDGTWGIAHTEAWTKAAEKAGATVGMKEQFTYTDEATVLPTLIVKAKAKNIDGIVWTGTEAGAIALVKKMQELNYNIPVLGTNYLKVASDAKKIQIKNNNISMIESARSESFNAKYRTAYGTEPNKYAESSYDLTMIVTQAEINKGSKDLRGYITGKEHKGFAKNYKFDRMGDITNLYWSITKIQ